MTLFRSTLLAAAWVAVSSGAGLAQTAALPDSDQAAFQLFEGELYLEEGRLEEAIASFASVVQLDPDRKEGHLLYAEALTRGLRSGLFEDSRATALLAMEHYAWVLDREPENRLAQAGRQFLADTFLKEPVSPAETEEGRAAWKEGKAALEGGDPGRAQEAFEKAVRAEPNSAPIHAALGEALRQGKHLDEAAREFERALEITPDYVPALDGLGKTHAARGDVAEALEAYERVLDGTADAREASNEVLALLGKRPAKSLSPAERSLLGRAHLELGDLDQAIPELEQAVAADSSLKARRSLGIARILAERSGEGIPLLLVARAANPRDLEVLYYLGIAHLREGKIEEGRGYLTEVLAYDPQNPNAQRVLGLSLAEEPERASDALQHLLAAHAAGADIDGFSCLVGGLWYRMGRPNEARMAWESCLREDPERSAAHLGLGVLADDHGDTRSAIDHFEAYLAKDTDPDKAAVFRLGVAYLRSGQDPKGFETLRKMIRPDSTAAAADTVSDVALLEATSYFLASARRYEDAIFIGEMLLTRDPENPLYNNNLAMSYADANRELGRAHTLAAKANRLSPDNPGHLDTMGWTLVRQGKLEEAEGILKKSIALAEKDSLPNLSEIHYHLGFVYREMGKHQDSVEALTLAAKDPPTPFLKSEIDRLLELEKAALGSR